MGGDDTSETKGRAASTVRPLIAPLHWVRAPAKRLSELRDNEPPTGKPPTAPAARLAIPWLTNSRFGSQLVRSEVAKVRAMAEASAKPTTAITSPGTSRWG